MCFKTNIDKPLRTITDHQETEVLFSEAQTGDENTFSQHCLSIVLNRAL